MFVLIFLGRAVPATTYKVWAWGPPVNIGATGACYVGVAGVAKRATAAEPHIVANEVFCNAVARMLLLPCPPGATLEKSAETYFFSLDFNLAGQALPPVNPSAIVASDPRLSWGIILFDMLVLNSDRHHQNIAYDSSTQRIQIFDHSHAFLRPSGDVLITLASSDGKLGFGGHCLAHEIDTYDGFETWNNRIKQIPHYFIDGVLDACATVGLPTAHKGACADFIKKRCQELEVIVQSNLASFPKLPKAKP
ncbi:hypothetical protein [Bradyrhizobium sp. 62]|uniref:hypothetical protein n=1 Tax=Bradyrhizobium sp. 62 TaxID=1043588 RepID=UPI001FF7B776|nr:hypothetical protein [Bradyrhizobium sp. 62]MCK1366406.1 hypothetical protein [Bradyrhizobium sp. 62]